MTVVLKRYSLALCLGLALVVSCWFGIYLTSDDALPYQRDGEDYALRAFLLYGFLHSGQWAHFWDLFTSPKQALLPLHNVIFFLLPQSWAGIATYMDLQIFTTYFLLAYAIWRMAQVLNRAEWAPALFLLCAVQNSVRMEKETVGVKMQ